MLYELLWRQNCSYAVCMLYSIYEDDDENNIISLYVYSRRGTYNSEYILLHSQQYYNTQTQEKLLCSVTAGSSNVPWNGTAPVAAVTTWEYTTAPTTVSTRDALKLVKLEVIHNM